MHALEILPDSRAKVRRNAVRIGSLNWLPIFCANCGGDGGLVPEENMTFAFYLCTPCSGKWSALAGTMMVPDEVFWSHVHQEQINKYGRILPAPELAEVLKDGNSTLAKLGRSREVFSSMS
jgi:hypothetical protein